MMIYVVYEVLKLLFSAFSLHIEHLVEDQLDGTKAALLLLEALILYNNNHTTKWLSEKIRYLLYTY